LELMTAQNQMLIINDAYNASPTSMRAAMNLLMEVEPDKDKWVLLGDIHEIGEQEETYHRELGEYAINKGISRIYTVGRRGYWIFEGAKASNQDPNRVIHHFSTLKEASESLHKAGNRNVILLIKASRAAKLDQVVQFLIEGA
jgi:UDP-N-acetylmuramoyl-tripeptide--D-alanyl-D-alanine ligase